MKKMKIWAHRGASGYAPENTMEAFSEAVRRKADGIELDVQLTKEAEPGQRWFGMGEGPYAERTEKIEF